MSYILKQRARRLLVWNNARPQIRNLPYNRRLCPIILKRKMFKYEQGQH
jgi:hypothetical protein